MHQAAETISGDFVAFWTSAQISVVQTFCCDVLIVIGWLSKHKVFSQPTTKT